MRTLLARRANAVNRPDIADDQAALGGMVDDLRELLPQLVGDLIAHAEHGPTPTQDAYDRACAALHKHRERARAVLDGVGAELPRPPDAVDLDEAMCSVWLHGDWRWLTRNMTTPQREAAADAVTRRTAAMDVEEGEPVHERAGLRWWRE